MPASLSTVSNMDMLQNVPSCMWVFLQLRVKKQRNSVDLFWFSSKGMNSFTAVVSNYHFYEDFILCFRRIFILKVEECIEGSQCFTEH